MGVMLEGNSVFEIASGDLQAMICPEMGGRVLKLRFREEKDILVPAQAQAFDVTDWPRAGAYPLIPYHNRLSDARIAAGGSIVPLVSHPAAAPHTLHGPSHTRPWRVVSHEAAKFVMKLDYRPDPHWPWHFEAVQNFEMDGRELKVTISVTNLGGENMPAGLGWHPYFSTEEPVETDAKFVWCHREDYLPTGERKAVGNEETESMSPTRYLEGWRAAHIKLPDGRNVTVSATSEFGFLVIHRGHASHICVEPVTHVANAWNMEADPVLVGARLLKPGETLKGSILVRVSGQPDELDSPLG